MSAFLLNTAPADQVEFLVARAVARAGFPKPWVWPLFLSSIFGMGLLMGLNVFLPLIPFGAYVIALPFLLRREREHAHDSEIKALDLTDDLDAALATVDLLPLTGRQVQPYPAETKRLKREALLKHWEKRRSDEESAEEKRSEIP